MPIRRGRLADIQAQQVEVGRIRLGSSTTKTSRAGKEYNEPVKLETFRLTSRSRDLIEEAVQLYGGEISEWQPQNGGAKQWQTFTERHSIAVIVPPDPVSQFYEVWASGKCQRRCDGLRELISDVPCICGPDPSQRRCKPTTRLSLMLAEMSGIGVWRLETHGYFAAAELPAVADLLSAVGGNVPARLEMEERSAVVPDPRKPGEEMITRFMVPVLHVQATPAQLIATLGSNGRRELEAPPDRPALEAPAAPVTGAGQALDPQQEQMRVWWALHTQFEDAMATASAQALPGIGNQIRQSGLPDQFVASLRVKYTDRMKALQSTPQPPPAANVPAQNGAGQLDRNAEMMAIQATAAGLGMNLPALQAAFTDFTNGQSLTGATAEQLAEFHLHLRDEP